MEKICSSADSVPWRLRDSGRSADAVGVEPAALLTRGLRDAERVVSVDRLIDAVWGERPPDTAAKLVQSYVSRLRQARHRPDHPEVIVTRPGGYHFRAGEDELDVRRFQNLLTHGRTEARNGEHAAAADTLAGRPNLWRGPALGGPETSTLQLEAARLEEMRMTAVEDMLGARPAAGAGAELVGEPPGWSPDSPCGSGCAPSSWRPCTAAGAARRRCACTGTATARSVRNWASSRAANCGTCIPGC